MVGAVGYSNRELSKFRHSVRVKARNGQKAILPKHDSYLMSIASRSRASKEAVNHEGIAIVMAPCIQMGIMIRIGVQQCYRHIDRSISGHTIEQLEKHK